MSIVNDTQRLIPVTKELIEKLSELERVLKSMPYHTSPDDGRGLKIYHALGAATYWKDQAEKEIMRIEREKGNNDGCG